MDGDQQVLGGPTLVHEFVAHAAGRDAASIALIEPQRHVTYGELDRQINRVANLLISRGLTQGDRVVIALENSIDLAAVYFGTMRAGAVAVPAPPGPRSNRLGQIVADCTPLVCIIDGATAHSIVPGHPLTRVPMTFVHKGGRSQSSVAPAPWLALANALEDAPTRPPAVSCTDLDLAAILYTSGSTAEPRGVMLTHRNIVSNTRSIVQYLALEARDRVMCVLPFCYSYGLSLLQTHAYVGGSVVIDTRFAYPDVVLRAMREHRVTGFAGVPSMFAVLLAKANLDLLAYPEFRYVTQAGDAMPVHRIREWCDRMPGIPFYVMYGATEASPRLTYLDPAALLRKLGSIGRPVPNVDLEVIREDGTRATTGEMGELVARGPNISCGYWNCPDDTRKRFGPEGYHTGDLGYVDEEGYFYLEGRIHDMIKSGGHRIGPREIEETLHQHPGVLEAAVIGSQHDTLGEVPVAFVVLHEGQELPSEALRAFCGARLPAYKVPVAFIYKRELPRISGRDKIDKRLLREEAVSRPDIAEPRR